MTRDEAVAVLDLPRNKVIDTILALAEKAEKYDQLCGQVTPSTPSGMTLTYLKPKPQGRPKRPGRKKGHDGVSRLQPQEVDHFKEHTLERCPDCQTPLKEAVKAYQRYTENIPPIEKPEVTEHTVHGYWCPQCKKVVFAPVPDAFPNAMIGLRMIVLKRLKYYILLTTIFQRRIVMAAVVGKCYYNGTEGKITMRYIGPIMRIALEFVQPVNSTRSLIDNLSSLESARSQVFELASEGNHFIIIAGNKFGDAAVPPPEKTGKLAVDTAQSILSGLESKVPALSFGFLEAYNYI